MKVLLYAFSSDFLHAGDLRLPLHWNSAIEALFDLEVNPPSLCQLTRRVVRQELCVHKGGSSIVAAVFQLPLPSLLQHYLLLSDTRRCHIDANAPHHCNFDPICCQSCATYCDGHQMALQCVHNYGHSHDPEYDCSTDEDEHEDDTSDMDIDIENWDDGTRL